MINEIWEKSNTNSADFTEFPYKEVGESQVFDTEREKRRIAVLAQSKLVWYNDPIVGIHQYAGTEVNL